MPFRVTNEFSCFYISFFITAFDISYFTDVLDLNYLVDDLKDDPKFKKFAKFNEALIGIIQDYSLVSFATLHVEVRKNYMDLLYSCVEQWNPKGKKLNIS